MYPIELMTIVISTFRMQGKQLERESRLLRLKGWGEGSDLYALIVIGVYRLPCKPTFLGVSVLHYHRAKRTL